MYMILDGTVEVIQPRYTVCAGTPFGTVVVMPLFPTGTTEGDHGGKCRSYDTSRDRLYTLLYEVGPRSGTDLDTGIADS